MQILSELMHLDEVTDSPPPPGLPVALMSVEAVSCADTCIRGDGGAHTACQDAVIHKCGVSPMLSVPPGAGYSGRLIRARLTSPSLRSKGNKNDKE